MPDDVAPSADEQAELERLRAEVSDLRSQVSTVAAAQVRARRARTTSARSNPTARALLNPSQRGGGLVQSRAGQCPHPRAVPVVRTILRIPIEQRRPSHHPQWVIGAFRTVWHALDALVSRPGFVVERPDVQSLRFDCDRRSWRGAPGGF